MNLSPVQPLSSLRSAPSSWKNAGTFSVGSNQGGGALLQTAASGSTAGRQTPMGEVGGSPGGLAGDVVGLISVQVGDLELPGPETGTHHGFGPANNLLGGPGGAWSCPTGSRGGDHLGLPAEHPGHRRLQLSTYGVDGRWGIGSALGGGRVCRPDRHPNGIDGGPYAYNVAANYNSRAWTHHRPPSGRWQRGSTPRVGFLPRTELPIRLSCITLAAGSSSRTSPGSTSCAPM